MKKLLPLLLALALLLSGCARREDAPPDPVQDPPPGTEEPSGPGGYPLELDILRIEICRGGLGSERLMEAARTLPELLRSTLAENQSIIADTVQLTIGSSPAATVQALNAGAVDIAILPAEGFAGQETEAAVLLASGPGANESPLWADSSGAFQASICAAPTDYGLNLAARAGKEGDLPTWEEMNRARWGLLEQDSLPGRRAVDLWLADSFEGNTTANLPFLFKLDDSVDLMRLKKAVEDVFDIHPGLKAVVQLHEGVFKNFRHDDRRVEVPMTSMSDEQWKEYQKGLLKPYLYTENEPLYHVEITRTDSAVYLYFDIAHIMGDVSP